MGNNEQEFTNPSSAPPSLPLLPRPQTALLAQPQLMNNNAMVYHYQQAPSAGYQTVYSMPAPVVSYPEPVVYNPACPHMTSTTTIKKKNSAGCCGGTKASVEIDKDNYVKLSARQGDCCFSREKVACAHLKDVVSVESEEVHANMAVAYLLWFFLGWIGAHRFYVGKWRSGLFWLFTGAFFGLGWLVDPFLIPSWCRKNKLTVSVSNGRLLEIVVDRDSVQRIESTLHDAHAHYLASTATHNMISSTSTSLSDSGLSH
eukprot:TRINITY_DN172_c0_g1_i2.p1 TRINITY_DN172_c0_g1~~TRINITY_DN172_c0_g1_i2.p1  ORF type:complete len:258 (-),score=70.62 TRINITY_DN172_c0_g1_i2:127-900(-)